jgi:hypothetical protein
MTVREVRSGQGWRRSREDKDSSLCSWTTSEFSGWIKAGKDQRCRVISLFWFTQGCSREGILGTNVGNAQMTRRVFQKALAMCGGRLVKVAFFLS